MYKLPKFLNIEPKKEHTIIDELREWIHEYEKPNGTRNDHWKTMSAHNLLNYLKDNYNITKK